MWSATPQSSRRLRPGRIELRAASDVRRIAGLGAVTAAFAVIGRLLCEAFLGCQASGERCAHIPNKFGMDTAPRGKLKRGAAFVPPLFVEYV
jgi:hypothetical protein